MPWATSALQAPSRQTLVDVAKYNDVRNVPRGQISGASDPGGVHNGWMRSKRSVVSPEDQALFLDAVGGATPLDGSRRDRLPIVPPPPSPVRVVTTPAAQSLTVEGDGHRYAARGTGVSRTQVSELRQGKIHVEVTLDLHGETTTSGLARLRTFLDEASRIGRRCVLVVHGKGLHSERGAPLREAVLGELLGPLSGYIHALSTAAPADGGEGATYVMLRGLR